MKNKKLKLIALAGVTVTTAVMLTGCGNKEVKTYDKEQMNINIVGLEEKNSIQEEYNMTEENKSSLKNSSNSNDSEEKNSIQEEYKVTEENKSSLKNNSNSKNDENGKIINENVQKELGEHMKWFSAAYLGTIYGWPSVYEYEDVTGTVVLPNAPEGAMIYELKGCKSINSIKTELAKYVSKDKFKKFEETSDFVNELTEYNGKVYWANAGVGDGPYISVKDAKVQSSKNGVTKIVLYEKHAMDEMLANKITVTVEYKDSKYLITDWVVESNN